MYEHRTHRPLTRTQFAARLASHGALGLLVLALALALGTVGYHLTDRLPWLDALLEAAMILTGMGPVSELVTPQAKWFATFYALFSGIVFLGLVGLVLAPVFHRVLHRLHFEDE